MMTPAPTTSPPPLPAAAAPLDKTLRRLFLTLFLRGRSARGLKRATAPKSVGQKLALALFFYALFGCMALAFVHQPVFALAVYLHAMTFLFLGMFVASSAGEVLFNKEEADILLHRPIQPRILLWAKIRVLVEVSLWLAGALNLVGLFVGIAAPQGNGLFPLAHALSTTLEALFCTGCVVLTYQLCLRWFGRSRLEGLMTTVQVLVSVAVVLGSQILPQIVLRSGKYVPFGKASWQIALLPPAWFAGFDDALAGTMAPGSWLLAACAILATGLVLWSAFGKLAGDYETGLQRLGENVSPRVPPRRGRRWMDVFLGLPPLRWWLRDPVSRAAFRLTAAYLLRDRDVKLRIYPGMAPILVLPVVFMIQDQGRGGTGSNGFGVAFASAYLGMVPLFALNLLQYSQQWQASDIFRAAPLWGPAALCHGARRAVLCFLTFPIVVIFALLIWLTHHESTQLLLLLPGLIALPVFALVPNLGGKALPLSLPTEEAKAAGRGLNMIGGMFVAMAVSGVGVWSWSGGWFWWFSAGEAILAVGVYVMLRRSLARARWSALE